MVDHLLSAGEFAKLARTTKRTVLWYDQQGILEPSRTEENGYRLYRPEQIIDFQTVLLMRRLGFSLADIKAYLEKGESLRQLFSRQRGELVKQIGQLQRMLVDTETYYHNVQSTGLLVQPQIKDIQPFEIYYLEKHGPYAHIRQYFDELLAMFPNLPATAPRLTVFLEGKYQPHRAGMYIGVVCGPGVTPRADALVRKLAIPGHRALTYVHRGSTTLLSLLWQQMGVYRRRKRLAWASGLPFADLEIYQPDTSPYPDPDDPLVTELRLPIR